MNQDFLTYSRTTLLLLMSASRRNFAFYFLYLLVTYNSTSHHQECCVSLTENLCAFQFEILAKLFPNVQLQSLEESTEDLRI